LVPLLFAGAFVVFMFGVPLGLPRVESAFPLASALALDSAGLDQAATPTLLWMRLVAYLPLGDLAFRGNLASVLLSALAVAWVARLCVDLLVPLRPAREARHQTRDFLHEPIAGVGAAFAAGMALSSFESATSLGLASATLLLVVAGWRCVVVLLNSPGSVPHALGLAALCGLSSSVHPIAGPILWPSFLWLAFWSLRRGQRWPLLAPLAFLTAFSVGGLSTLAASSTPMTFARWFASYAPPAAYGVDHFPRVIVQLADQLGVIGGILTVMGMGLFLSRNLPLGLWILLSLVTSVLFCPDQVVGTVETARVALSLSLLLSAFGIAGGIYHLAMRMGRAKSAASFALAVICVVSPAVDGGGTRWLPRVGLPMRLLGQGLAKVGPRSKVDPGSVEMAGLFRLAKTMGLRPDLEFTLPSK
jgi:hypothetical protein